MAHDPGLDHRRLSGRHLFRPEGGRHPRGALLLAAFLAIVLSPPYGFMRRKGIPDAIALIVMILGLGFIALLAVTILKTSLDQFITALPGYEANLRLQMEGIWAWLEAQGVDTPKKLIADNLDPQFVMRYAGRVARALSGMLGQTLLIFIVVAFMLVEASGLHRKIHAIPGVSQRSIAALDKNFENVRRYVSLKSIMSLLTGALVTAWLWLLDIDNALFMGLLAFFLNFVPTIGSFIAAVPGVVLAFILLGPGMAAVAAIGYTVINVGVSNVIEPRYMGQGLGISPLVIILSLIFWGWLLGPIGMLLSVPLTMAVKAGLEMGEATKTFALLLGPAPKD